MTGCFGFFKKNKKDKKPTSSAFKQQRLPAWKPILTPVPVIFICLLIGVLFIPMGIVLLVFSDDIVQVGPFRYDEDCPVVDNFTCNFQFTIDQDMQAPIYFYYKLENYYQNYRLYVRSRSDLQLRGDDYSRDALDECSPRISSTGDDDEKDESKLFLPCGLIAGSYFNDSLENLRYKDDDKIIDWTEEGIAWSTDIDNKFENPPESQPGVKIPYIDTDFKNETFIVWMRAAAFPTFRKLRRIINQDLKAGEYLITIDSRFPVDEFDGRKSIILTTTNWIGGKNPIIGILYIVVGALSLVLGLLFLFKHTFSPRRLADTTYLRFGN
eukprot:TRINITY_DN1490_c1_g1_i1.p1 TRINITY_DN1490_c1_g1~~TRINITY_DN1490_c1_g1_i1.p1  ORF type:complete len:339 (-),score=147.20 TRINITY_DN1490_c1_g1_i1:41-1015(-)